MARKNRNDYDDDDYENYDDNRRSKKSGGWYGKFLLITLLVIASVVGFLVYRTYEMLTTGEKVVYVSPMSQQQKAQTDDSNVAVLSPTSKDAFTPSGEEFNIAHGSVEQLSPEQEVYAPPVENADSVKAAPIDPTNRRFDQELDNLF